MDALRVLTVYRVGRDRRGTGRFGGPGHALAGVGAPVAVLSPRGPARQPSGLALWSERRCPLTLGRRAPLSCLLLAACWSGDAVPLGGGPTPWRPAVDAPSGWEIARLDTPHACPDGSPAHAWIIRPLAAPAEPRPIALVLHDGAFDYPLQPLPPPDDTDVDTDPGTDTDPVGGPDTWRSPSRLTADWAARHAWSVAGLWPSDDEAVKHDGGLPAALARRGIATLLPGSCWGDYGVNDGDNDLVADGFARRGGAQGRWAWRLVAEDGFAEAEGVPLGLTPDTSVRLLVGLGEGGRGASAILRGGGPAPTALLADSPDDDLGVFFDDPAAWADRITGLERIWPAGRAAADAQALATAPLPERTAVLLSAADPRMPPGVVDDLVTRVQQIGGRVVDTGRTAHVQTAGDPLLAEEIAGWMLGEEPGGDTDSGDTDGGDTDGG